MSSLSQRQTSPSQASVTQKRNSTPKQEPNNALNNNNKLVPGKGEGNKRASSTCLTRRSSETTQNRNEGSKYQRNTREVGSSGSKTSRYTSYGMMENRLEEKILTSVRNRGNENKDMEIVDLKSRRSLTISSAQEDFSRSDRAPMKKKRENNKSAHTKALPNDENMVSQSGDFVGLTHKEKKLRTNSVNELALTAQNKSISFQSSTGNLFQDVEASFAVINEDNMKEEVDKDKESFWPKEISLKEIDIKNFDKGLNCFENTLNPVTSPSFGTQTTENHFKKMFENNKNKGKTSRGNSDKKETEHNVIGKLYGGGSLMKKKKWTPLLAKKG